MKFSPSFSKILSRVQIKSKDIDIVRDPYKVWLCLSILFGIALIIVALYDFSISQKLQAGTLVSAASQSQASTPLISETELTNTAQIYTNRAAALAALVSGQNTPSPVVDPSQ